MGYPILQKKRVILGFKKYLETAIFVAQQGAKFLPVLSPLQKIERAHTIVLRQVSDQFIALPLYPPHRGENAGISAGGCERRHDSVSAFITFVPRIN